MPVSVISCQPAYAHEMKANYDRLCDGYAAGRVTKAELDEAFDELSAYIRETDEKYN